MYYRARRSAQLGYGYYKWRHMSISKSFSIPVKFHPSKTFKFPKRSFGAKKVERSFRAQWCEDFEWLHYDIESDSAFCHLCQTAEVEKKLLASTKKDSAFLIKGFILIGKKQPLHFKSIKQVCATKRQPRPYFICLNKFRVILVSY